MRSLIFLGSNNEYDDPVFVQHMLKKQNPGQRNCTFMVKAWNVAGSIHYKYVVQSKLRIIIDSIIYSKLAFITLWQLQIYFSLHDPVEMEFLVYMSELWS